MDGITPAQWAQFMTTLILLMAALANYLKSRTNGQKLDENTALTREVHTATNGKLSTLVDAVTIIAQAHQAVAQQVFEVEKKVSSSTPKGD